MSKKIHESLYNYYESRPDKFEYRADSHKSTINFALSGACFMLLISPSILHLNDLAVRIAAGAGLIYFGLTAYFRGREWYGLASGCQIKKLAVKKFVSPRKDSSPFSADEQRILELFDAGEWEKLAAEPESPDGILQLHIHEDEAAEEFYAQINRDSILPEDFLTGISEVKIIGGEDYEKHYQTIKGLRKIE